MRKCFYFLLSLYLIIAGCQNTKDISSNTDAASDLKMAASLDSLFNEFMDQKQMAGVVCLLNEKGKTVYSNALGYRNIEEGLPMEEHSLFRLQSMSKPIVSLAIMKLCSEGKISLDDHADKYFPQLKDKQVGIMKEGVLTYVPANRPITIRDLLSHTSGFGSSWNAGELAGVYEQHEFYPDFKSYEHWIESYMELPLINHPGEEWYYGHGHVIMEYLITKVSGMSHKDYITREIFKPLKMDKTTYYLPEGEEKTLAQFYSLTENGQLKRTLQDSAYTGGDDPMSNVEDYLKLCTLFLNNGYLDGKEFINPALMNELKTPVIGLDGELIPLQRGYAFALGVAVRVNEEKANWKGSPGDYGWHGYYNTSFWIDPQNQMIGIILTQSPFNNYVLCKEVKNVVYTNRQTTNYNQ